MTAFAFSKLIPGGNPTIILHDPAMRQDPDYHPDGWPGNPADNREHGPLDGLREAPAADLATVSAALMSSMHLQAEQVGALFSAEAHEWSPSAPQWRLPRLVMMGGEFCVNAVRSAALCLARQGRLTLCDAPGAPGAVWSGWLSSSGAEAPVRVLVAREEAALERAVAFCAGGGVMEVSSAGQKALSDATSLFCAAEVACPPPHKACAQERPDSCLVSLPGISHLLLDAHKQTPPNFAGDDWQKESRDWRVRSGIAELPASGVIWYRREPDGYSILPAVAVKATASEHLESACGSASLALALLHACSGEAAPSTSAGSVVLGPVRVLQPSGKTLTVTLALPPDSGSSPSVGLSPDGASDNPPGCSAWVAGPVVLAADGMTYV